MCWKLVIADDHEILRDGLAKILIARNSQIQVVDSVGDAQSAVIACRKHQPDLLVLDIEMPGRDSLAAIREVKLVSSSTRILMLTSYSSEIFITAANRGGAEGYVLKSEPVDVIIDAMLRVLNGGTAYSESVRAKMAKTHSTGSGGHRPAWLDELTPREIEILRYIGKGLDNTQMARAMSLSKRTVERHVSRLMDAVGIRERASLAELAHTHGYVAAECRTAFELAQ
jgi:DNA-binding NarL/FixJ family response regulator